MRYLIYFSLILLVSVASWVRSQSMVNLSGNNSFPLIQPDPTGGIVIGTNPIQGSISVGIDSTEIPRYYTGQGAPTQNCTQGRDFYTDTVGLMLYFCPSTNTWQHL